MEITINLPETVTFKRAGVDMEIKTADIPANIWGELAQHGLPQKVGDAAAGVPAALARDAFGAAKFDKLDAPARRKVVAAFTGNPDNLPPIQEAARAAMDKVLDALRAGDWGVKRSSGGSGLTDLEQEIARVAIAAIDGLKDRVKGEPTATRYRMALDELEAKGPAAWAKVEERAKVILAAKAAVDDLEL